MCKRKPRVIFFEVFTYIYCANENFVVYLHRDSARVRGRESPYFVDINKGARYK